MLQAGGGVQAYWEAREVREARRLGRLGGSGGSEAREARRLAMTWTVKDLFDLYVNLFVLPRSVAAVMDDETRCDRAPPAPRTQARAL